MAHIVYRLIDAVLLRKFFPCLFENWNFGQTGLICHARQSRVKSKPISICNLHEMLLPSWINSHLFLRLLTSGIIAGNFWMCRTRLEPTDVVRCFLDDVMGQVQISLFTFQSGKKTERNLYCSYLYKFLFSIGKLWFCRYSLKNLFWKVCTLFELIVYQML